MNSLIMALKRTPAERLLLARICYRAAGNKGVCEDSNREIEEAINIKFKTVSELITLLNETDLIQVIIDPKKANKRSIVPRADLLLPYQESLLTYQKKTDRKPSKPAPDYPEKPEGSPEKPDSDYPEKPDSTIPENRIPYPEKPDSYNKDIENSLENSSLENQQHADESADDAGGHGENKVDEFLAKKQQKLDAADAAKNPPPVPPPLLTAEEVREVLSESARTKRYATEQLKLIKDEPGYQALIEKFIVQRELEAENTGKPAFGPLSQTRHRFFNWLGKQAEIAQKTTNNGSSTNRRNRRDSDQGDTGAELDRLIDGYYST